MTNKEKAEHAMAHLEVILPELHDAVLNCYFCGKADLDKYEVVDDIAVWQAIIDYGVKVLALMVRELKECAKHAGIERDLNT